LAWRSTCAGSRSGSRPARVVPVAIRLCPALPTMPTSCAESCSRSRSIAIGSAAPVPSPSRSAASRVLVPTSATIESIVPRPRLRPASRAPSTLTSNQLSIERETNW
jgi:hypothetical protein